MHNRNFGRAGSDNPTYQELLAEIHPEDRERCLHLLEAALSAGEPIDAEVRVIWPDGSLHWLRIGGQRVSEPGRPERLIGISFDITDRKTMEAGLREERATLATLNRVGRTLAAELDLERVVQSVTDAATELTGAQFGAFFYNVLDDQGGHYTLYALSGAPREAFEKFPMPRATALFGPTFSGEGIVRSGNILKDPRYGKNAPHFGMPANHLPVVSYLAVPVVSRSGEVLGGLFFGHEKPDMFTERAERIVAGIASQAAIAIDNARLYQSAQKEIADRSRAEEQQRLLMDELNHRVRNTLAIVLAIANQTLRHASSAERFRSDFEARITALSHAHNLMTDSQWEGTSLRNIVDRVLMPYSDEQHPRHEISGDEVRIGPKYAVSLLMAFHELATNAAKYGALSNAAGRVLVSWTLEQPPRPPALTLEWRETGGPPVKARRRRGFGSRLIDGLAAETNGTVQHSFERGGVVCTITLPLSPAGGEIVAAS